MGVKLRGEVIYGLVCWTDSSNIHCTKREAMHSVFKTWINETLAIERDKFEI